MFLENKYTKIYNAIIAKAQSRVTTGIYIEKHHIIPKSLGGSDDNSNLVKLTAREHFICHLLLTKMTEGKARSKMAMAVFYLTGRGKAKRNNVVKNSKLYETLAVERAKFVSKQKKGCKQPPRTKETKKRLTESKTGKLNPKFKGYYITPWGKFESSRLAAKESILSDVAILNFCTVKNNKEITKLSVLRSKGYLTNEHVGKTPKQLGFTFMKGGKK